MRSPLRFAIINEAPEVEELVNAVRAEAWAEFRGDDENGDSADRMRATERVRQARLALVSLVRRAGL